MSIFHGYAELDLSPGNSIQGTASLDLTENVIKVDFFIQVLKRQILLI